MKKGIISILLMAIIILISGNTIVFAEETEKLEVGDIIYFGSYPQSQVTDEEIINILNQQTVDSDNNVAYGENKYKKYREDYYLYQPIACKVLYVEDTRIFVVTDKTLDAQPYHKNNVSITWEQCTLRTWLNETFFNEAFSTRQKDCIQTASLVNSSNPYYSYITDGGNPTLDKVFLLSYADVMNTNYGFDSGIEDSLTRCSTLTDYAKQRANNSSCASNGKPYGSSATDAIYWLRNPGKANNCACTVKPYGCSEGQMNKADMLYWGVFDDRIGVRPAFYIDVCYIEGEDDELPSKTKYQYFEGGISWYDAQAKCEELGGHLLVISSAEEQEFINSYVEGLRQAGNLTKQNIWLGATITDGVMQWVTDEEVEYTNWADGEPNNVFGVQDCVMMYTALSVNGGIGYWNDENGNGRDWRGYRLSDTGYICEWEAGYNLKNNAQYSIQIIDSITNRPIRNCKIQLSEDEFYISDERGVVILSINDIKNYIDKEIKILSDGGYEEDSFYITDLNLYSQNIIKLKSKNNLIDSLNLSFEKQTLTGPKIGILGYDIPLFEFEMELNLSNIPGLDKIDLLKKVDEVPFTIKVDEEKKIIKMLLGVKEGYEISGSEDFFEDYYKSFKDYYKLCNKKAKYPEIKNAYSKIKNCLQKFNANLVFSASATAAGYLEWDYSGGLDDLKLKEGGVAITAEMELKYGVPLPIPVCNFAYVDFGGKGEVKAEPGFSSNGIVLDASLSIKPFLEAGVKALSEKIAKAGAGFEGELKMELGLPANTLQEALEITLGGNMFLNVQVVGLFNLTIPLVKFPDIKLFPKLEENVIESINSEISTIPRSYLVNTLTDESFVTENITGFSSINEVNVYPYGEPKIVKLQDERLLALWIKDDGTKSDNNRTSLYFSIYENEVWSEPEAVYESGRSDFAPQIAVDGNTVYILWQRATQIFEDTYEIDTVLESMELVYSKFESDRFLEPMIVTENTGKYQMDYSIASENGTIIISWCENSENDYTLESGMNNLYSRILENGVWSAINIVKSDVGNINDLESGFLDGVPQIAYSVEVSEGNESSYELFIGEERITNNSMNDTTISYQNNQFYWKSGEYICYYDGTQIVNTLVNCSESNYKVLSEDDTLCMLFIKNDGFKNELYVSHCIDEEYKVPVALTSYNKHISYYDAVLYDGDILALMNIDNMSKNQEEGDSPYTTTDLICDIYENRTDIAIDDFIIYDEESIYSGNVVTFGTNISNVGTLDVEQYSLSIVDEEGTILVEQSYEEILEIGEVKEVEIEYTIPENFSQTKLCFIVSTENESVLTDNNEISIMIGKADLELLDCIVENNIIKSSIQNKGVVLAKDIVVEISYFDGEKTVLTELEIEDLEPGEISEFEYELQEEYFNFENYYEANRFIISVISSSEEIKYSNNDSDILISPVRVQSITLDRTSMSMNIKESKALSVEIQPFNAVEQGVIWISDSIDIATVDETGIVTAIAKGTAIITAISKDGEFVASCTVMVEGHEHEYSEEWTVDVEPTKTTNGVISRHCIYCDSYVDETELEYLKFSGASLTLYDNLTINYKVDKSLFEENGYQNPYVKFSLNGVETVVEEYRVVEDKYIFDFDDIAPNRMKDTIYATLYAEFNDTEYASETKEYSIGEYCYSMLEQYSTEEYSELRTLLVDLLNYGSETQNYTSYNVNNLVNQSLTEEQRTWATVELSELQTVFNKQYETIENPSIVWKSAGLKLEDSVTMRFKIETDSVENLIVKVVSESGQEWSIASSNFEVCDDGYYIYFDGLNAGQMREVIYITIYKETEVVSDTICYSIESYAYAMQSSENEKLLSLLKAMMKYGDSAYAYIH